MLVGLVLSNSIQQLRIHKLRSFLTLIGIAIASCSTVIILSLGNSVQSFISMEVDKFGANQINIAVKDTGDDIYLTAATINTLMNSPYLPEISTAYGVHSVNGTIAGENNTLDTSISGTQAAIFEINNSQSLKSGTYFTEQHNKNKDRVAVVNENVVSDLFKNPDNALYSIININGKPFKIIGIISDQTQVDDYSIYIPIDTLFEFLAPTEPEKMSYGILQTDNSTNYASFIPRLEYVLTSSLNVNLDQLIILTMEQQIDLVSRILLGIQAFLVTIATISLVVGGINIMNVMLVTVQERTKEIGLRKAIGAKPSTILLQFIVESLTLSFFGGFIGIVLAIISTYTMVYIINIVQSDFSLPFTISLVGILIAFTLSLSTGLLASIYPARKAARLEASVALSYE